MVEKVLRSFPSKFESIVATTKEEKYLSILSMDELMGFFYLMSLELT